MRFLAMLCLAAALAACDSNTAPELSVPGTYALDTFNGEPVAGIEGVHMEWTDAFGSVNEYWIVGGSIALRPNGDYHDELVIRMHRHDLRSDYAISHSGTWEATGSGSSRTVSFTRKGYGETCGGTLTHAGLACSTSRGEGVYLRHE